MKLLNIFKNFKKDEDGAVTVDWVVLTAAIVGLGIAVVTAVSGGLTQAAGSLVEDLDAAMITAKGAVDTGGGTGGGETGGGETGGE